MHIGYIGVLAVLTIGVAAQSQRCGVVYGKCPADECCNRDGYCGNTPEYCGIQCDNMFGQCDLSADIPGQSDQSQHTLFRRQEEKTPDQKMQDWIDSWKAWMQRFDYQQQVTRWDEWVKLRDNERLSQGQRLRHLDKITQWLKSNRQTYVQTYQEQLQKWQEWVNFQKRIVTDSNGKQQLRCGEGIGSCINGGCCSANNLCGTDADSCETGCQFPFGECASVSINSVSPPPFDNSKAGPFQNLNKRCTSPSIRKEFRELSWEDRRSYIDAIKCLRRARSTFPKNTGSRSLYDDFVYTHVGVGNLAHTTAVFLPWHRLFMQNYEDALRNVCGYTGFLPYWDWSLDSSDPMSSEVWSDDFMGGDGDPTTNCIVTGPFAGIKSPYPAPHCVRRKFLLSNSMFAYTYTPRAIRGLIREFKTFGRFHTQLERNPHSGVHFGVGGEMDDATISAGDPVFFLHHANIDRLWAIWQEQDPNNMNDFSGPRRPSSPFNHATLEDHVFMLGLSGDLRVKDVMSTTSGGRFCYKYSNPNV
ncbi:hypothetical protein BASA60_011553 [Batrachochytrium salamandrivorans]|nr:hypothetical protein BASA60_011553 [Batrachochytrium salamandrivorans]KAH6572978.1 hypothetical protein BASA62_003156 [Batrachochytrium salamandrivorans]KAH9264265.1 hypothetical protein BASA83_012284 [Batrachochytrium salamandrivorans]